jgi:hypothetical protein
MRFYQRLMADIRRSIGSGTFAQFCRSDPRCEMGPADVPPEVAQDGERGLA